MSNKSYAPTALNKVFVLGPPLNKVGKEKMRSQKKNIDFQALFQRKSLRMAFIPPTPTRLQYRGAHFNCSIMNILEFIF